MELARLADSTQLRRMTDAISGLAETLSAGAGGVDAAGFAAAAAEVARTARVGVNLIDEHGDIVGDVPPPPDPAGQRPTFGRWPDARDRLLEDALAGRKAESSRYDSSTGRRLLAVAVPLGPPGRPVAVLRAVADTTEADVELSRSQRSMLVGYLCLTLATIAGGYGLAKRITRPVKELSQAAAKLASGDVDAAIPMPELAELSELARAVHVLREQLVERGLTIGRQGTQQEAVLGSMIEGVLAIDARQRIVSINRAAADLLGLAPQSAILRPLQEAVRNPDLRRFALRAIDCREPVEDDLLLRGAGERTIRVRGTALRDPSGEGGAVIVLNDVTDIQRLESVRRDFVANVSHELRTPIASIKGFVETLLDGAAEDPADSRRFLDIVARQADRLESIVEDLLALSRIEQSEEAGNLPLEPARIADVLSAVIAECRPRADERSIRLEVACDGEMVAEVNAPLLEQAAINLIDNAVKYSAPGRTVWISAEQDGADGGPPAMTIAVRDEGCGIESEHLPRLFERFYRVDPARSRKLGGTGLGLSIVKHIVQAHGGTIGVESEPGVGSRFTIRLPLQGQGRPVSRAATA
ncbi:MAG: sensor histidine kinase [Planctomycetia bacterium]|nr:sensor histidine kinase [Planctomycetia bacterium]